MSIEIPLTESEKHWKRHPNMRQMSDSRMGGVDNGVGSVIGLVRTSTLATMTGNPVHYGKNDYDTRTVDSLVEDLKSGRGFNEPLGIEYHRDLHKAYVGEGNHRLLAAQMAGHEYVPAMVLKSEYAPKFETDVRGRFPQRLKSEKKLFPWSHMMGGEVYEHHPMFMHPKWVFHEDDVLD